MIDPKQVDGGLAPPLPSPDYLQRWDEQVVKLQNENKKLRHSLVATRTILVQLKELSPPGLGPGFDLWIANIDASLK